MGKTQELGQEGERLATLFLQNNGYQILAKNFQYQRAEIDLIALKNELLIFIEVRLRTSTNFGFPEQTISPKKIQAIRKAAEQYIIATNWHKDIRFDVIAIHYENQQPIITHLQDVFE
ncbi:MAG: YraN family protein [Microscillaceae bacterium]|nr:YraN family protein [Microscillaceae bacterium]MDW8461893.1 YraN family protein [Cytophagales bacterium]